MDTLVEEEVGRFEGTWKYDSMIVEGRRSAEEHFESARLILEGDRFEMTDSWTTPRGTFTADPTITPRTIEVKFTEGPEAGKMSKGVYELEGDTYTVCIGLAGRERPKGFACEPDSGHALQVLRRIKF